MELDAFTDEYYVSADGERYQIFPMKLKHKTRVANALSKFDPENLFLNMPAPKLNPDGEPLTDKRGRTVMDTTAYDAMLEVFMLALNKTKKEIEEIVDLSNGVTIIDHFLQVSSLKKKIRQDMMTKIIGEDFMQDSSKTQA